MTNAQGNCRWVAVPVALVSMMLAATAAPAQTFTTLATVGGEPYAPPSQGTDGNFYGTTSRGGSFGAGSIYKVTLEGAVTTLYGGFVDANDGPYDALLIAADGSFYGTAFIGTIFRITEAGEFTTVASLFDFDNPYSGLVRAPGGDFFGTTAFGGQGEGLLFRVTPGGTLSTLYAFCTQPNCADGSFPVAGLLRTQNGNLYGVTGDGGAYGYGTVFRFQLTLRGSPLTTLYSFSSSDGANPYSTLIQGRDGNFYGTTWAGGASNDGTIFKITAAGALTTLHTFAGTDGANPYGALVEATDGNFYGTTVAGGAGTSCLIPNGCGTVFEMTPVGVFTTLHNFDLTDGANPYAGLLQATNGVFYGTTFNGGTVFSLDMGLGPFVKTVTNSGTVGSRVQILGNNLKGATMVAFNGIAATFKVISLTEIGATIPTGATTGPVQVANPSGTLTSNVNFRVLP